MPQIIVLSIQVKEILVAMLCIPVFFMFPVFFFNSDTVYIMNSYINSLLIPYSGKLSREKTFTNFAVLDLPTKVFSSKFGHAMHTYDRFCILLKFSLRNGHTYPVRKSFLPRKFPVIWHCTACMYNVQHFMS